MNETKSYVKVLVKKGVQGGVGFDAEFLISDGTTEKQMDALIELANKTKDKLLDKIKF